MDLASLQNLFQRVVTASVKRKYPASGSFTRALKDADIDLISSQLKRFTLDNEPWPPERSSDFKRSSFDNCTGVTLFFPNVYRFHDDLNLLKDALKDLNRALPIVVVETPKKDEEVYFNELVVEIGALPRLEHASFFDAMRNPAVHRVALRIQRDLESGRVDLKTLAATTLRLFEPYRESVPESDHAMVNGLFQVFTDLKEGKSVTDAAQHILSLLHGR